MASHRMKIQVPGRYPLPKRAPDSVRKSEISDISEVVPPSATRVCPTMYPASSEHKNTAIRAISRGSP